MDWFVYSAPTDPYHPVTKCCHWQHHSDDWTNQSVIRLVTALVLVGRSSIVCQQKEICYYHLEEGHYDPILPSRRVIWHVAFRIVSCNVRSPCLLCGNVFRFYSQCLGDAWPSRKCSDTSTIQDVLTKILYRTFSNGYPRYVAREVYDMPSDSWCVCRNK